MPQSSAATRSKKIVRAIDLLERCLKSLEDIPAADICVARLSQCIDDLRVVMDERPPAREP